MDPISLGGSISAAMELHEMGAITSENTGGVELQSVNAQAMTRMTEVIITGEGIGADIGQGARGLYGKYGHPGFALVVKGQKIPGYDTRAMHGMRLAQAASSRRACHMRAARFLDDFTHVFNDGKAEIVKNTQDGNAAKANIGLRALSGNAWDMNDHAAQFDDACGRGRDEARMLEVGERTYTLERQFNLCAGLTTANDTLPNRF